MFWGQLKPKLAHKMVLTKSVQTAKEKYLKSIVYVELFMFHFA